MPLHVASFPWAQGPPNENSSPKGEILTPYLFPQTATIPEGKSNLQLSTPNPTSHRETAGFPRGVSLTRCLFPQRARNMTWTMKMSWMLMVDWINRKMAKGRSKRRIWFVPNQVCTHTGKEGKRERGRGRWEGEEEGERGRQTDGRTDRQRQRQRFRDLSERQSDREKGGGRERERHTHTHTHTHTWRHREKDTDTQTQTEPKTEIWKFILYW